MRNARHKGLLYSLLKIERQRIEKTIFVKADRSIKLEENAKIIEAAQTESNASRYDDLLISNGIQIVLSSVVSGESVLVINISKDGEFMLGEKRLEKAALEKEIRDRIKARPTSERVVYIKAGPDISYGSLEILITRHSQRELFSPKRLIGVKDKIKHGFSANSHSARRTAMKRTSFLTFSVVALLALGLQTASAQFPKVPKIPKIKVETPKPEQPQPDSGNPSSDSPSATSTVSSSTYSAPVRKSQYDFIRPTARPLLVKDSIYVQAETHDEYWKTPAQKTSSWVPTVQFSLYYDWQVIVPHVVEYFNPDGSLWFSETLEGDRPTADDTVPFKRDYYNTQKLLAAKSTAAIGAYGIKITNKTSGEVAFQGKFKVGKFPRPWKGKTSVEFYVDHDWLIPIGSVSFHYSNFSGQNLGTNFPVMVSMWFKKAIGSTDHGFEARLFYKDQQIATTSRLQANETRASETGNLSGELHHWARWDFQWTPDGNVGSVTIDNGGSYHKDNMPKSFFVDRNPGEYMVKVYQKGVQVRGAKFTAGADGRVVDAGYYKPGYLTYYKVIIPVTVIGAAEKWNAAAWKTEAFYGNPMTGFAVP